MDSEHLSPTAVQFVAKGRDLFFFHISQIGSALTQPTKNWGPLSVVKRLERQADYLSPSSAEIKECMELYFHSTIRLCGIVVN
jgi:hypothetical protein